MKTVFFVVIGMLLVGTAGITWHAARAARETNATVGALRQKETQLGVEIRRTEARISAAESKEAALRSTLEKLNEMKSVTTTTTAPAPRGATTASPTKGKLSADQERTKANAQVLRLAEQRVSVTKSYRPLFDRLGLSAAQREQFVDITMKAWERGMDLSALKNEGLLPPDDPAAVRLRTDALARRDAAYRELLGDQGYQQWQEYARSAVPRRFVQDIAAVALMEGVPFTAVQLEQLVSVVANGDSGYRGGQAFTSRPETIDWDLVDANARPLMSDVQWKLYTSVASDPGWDRFWFRLRRSVSEAEQVEAASRSAKPPRG